MVIKLNASIEETFLPARKREIVSQTKNYLRSVSPKEPFQMPDEQLDRMVRDSIDHAKSLGVTKVSALKKYSYLWGLSGGQIASTKEATDFIRFGGRNPDDQVSALLKNTAQAIRENGSEIG